LLVVLEEESERREFILYFSKFFENII